MLKSFMLTNLKYSIKISELKTVKFRSGRAEINRDV